MAYAYRARFNKDIVAEFLPSRKPSRKVAVLCIGMPGMPSKSATLEFLSQKGYWIFSPRYRGSWESGGGFLRKSPHEDILDIIDELPRGFKDIYSGKKYKFKPETVHLFGSSFGGPAAILASRDRRIGKAVIFSPVVDWRAKSKAEPLNWLGKFTKEAFGEGYRYSKKDWNKLKDGKFYNPMFHAKQIDGGKLFLIAAKDDDVVSSASIKKFARVSGAKLKLIKQGGHLSSANLMKPKFWKQIKNFLRS